MDLDEKLKPTSRINYAKMYTIEHNIPVSFIGKIDEESEATLISDFKMTQSW
jgi:hypothetical protein